MTSNLRWIAVLLAAGTALSAAPANAQNQPAAAQAQATIAPSKGASKALVELQAAVNANDTVNIPARIAAAEAVVSTPQDRYILGSLKYQAAVTSKNDSAAVDGINQILASGLAEPGKVLPYNQELGKAYLRLKQYDQAAEALQRVVSGDPANNDAMLLLAETRIQQGRPKDAVAIYQKGIERARQSGAKPTEALYKSAVALAYKQKLPEAIDLSQAWVSQYPAPASWRDAVGIYVNLKKPGEEERLDLLRLAYATGSLNGAGDYERLAYLTLTRGFPAEAKAVLDQGVSSGVVDASKPPFRELMAEAKAKSAADPVVAAQAVKSGTGAANAKVAMTNADLLYGLGKYSDAATVYRSALTKAGANSNLVNLRLGMALARAGDKAGATAALNAVSGDRTDLAKYWLLYLDTKA